MFSAHPFSTSPPDDPQIVEIRDSLRVLTEVIRHLGERVELLETRESLNRLRPATDH